MTYRQVLWGVAADNHGILTVDQAEEFGVPAVEVRKLASRGALKRVGHGVYQHLGIPIDHWTDLAAALACVGEDAFLEGDTVLAMFDLALVNPAKIHIGTPRRRRNRPPWLVTVTVRPHMPKNDVTHYKGMRCATVRRALLDRIPYLLPERLQEATETAERHDLIEAPEATEILAAIESYDRMLGWAS